MLCVWFSSFKNVRHPICINKIKLIPKSGKLTIIVQIIEYLPVHSFFLKRTVQYRFNVVLIVRLRGEAQPSEKKDNNKFLEKTGFKTLLLT